MDKQLAIKSKLMKFEAVALFAGVRAEIESERWQYFREARKQDFPYSLAQNISAYRASLNFTYVYQDISTIVYLEREAHIGKPGENLWTLSFSCIEGKTQALVIANALSELKEKGYYIPNGNENLERQMNFSLGLYGSCLMHVDILFPTHLTPLSCFCEVMDCIEQKNSLRTQNLKAIMERDNVIDDDDDILIMGDWQTWK